MHEACLHHCHACLIAKSCCKLQRTGGHCAANIALHVFTGGGVVDALLATGTWNIRAMTRNEASAKGRDLSSRGVEVVQGDLMDKLSLVKAGHHSGECIRMQMNAQDRMVGALAPCIRGSLREV